MNASLFLTLCFLSAYLALGLLSSRLMKLIHFPNVTGYLLTGIIFGPYVLGAIADKISGSTDLLSLHCLFGSPLLSSASLFNLSDISWLSNVALAFIAFTIGQSFEKEALKSAGKRILITAFTEALGGSAFVFFGLLIGHFFSPDAFPWPLILTLAAIASATAPAATVLVIRQYKAHGPVVDTLLPVVALDDAVALILFAIFFSLAKALSGGEISIYPLLVIPLMEIFLSLGLGTVLGLLLSWLTKWFHSLSNRLIWVLAALLLISGLSSLALFPASSPLKDFAFSPLLAAMMVGAIYCNTVKKAEETLKRIDEFTPPLFMMFFIISGAQLDVSVYYRDMSLLRMFLPLAFIYFFMRSGGKYLGARVGSLTDPNADPRIKKYLGLMLLPQAGVAIGLATTAGQQLSALYQSGYTIGEIIVSVILSTTILYNILGAYLTKEALIAAGQVDGLGPNKKEGDVS